VAWAEIVVIAGIGRDWQRSAEIDVAEIQGVGVN